MKEAFIIESFNLENDFRDSVQKLKELGNNGDEGDILYESESGIFMAILSVSQDYDSITQKFTPRYWFNENLGVKLNLIELWQQLN